MGKPSDRDATRHPEHIPNFVYEFYKFILGSMDYEKLRGIPERGIYLAQYMVELKKEGKLKADTDFLQILLYVKEDMSSVAHVLSAINDKEVSNSK